MLPEAFYLVHSNSKTASLNLVLVVYKKRDLLFLIEFSIKEIGTLFQAFRKAKYIREVEMGLSAVNYTHG